MGDDTATITDSTGDFESFGPYRLLRKLGEGGMGEVFLGEQTEPIRRKVAVKLIKAGMDSRQIIARFEAERQALALMDHSMIAKVLDAGTTPRGLPYFVMEYVPGDRITSHCDRHKLTTHERLTLFMQVCEGVQHAHQKGIIHRDLKPSNVLVATSGDHPIPKIIDFGVAKAMAQRLTERTVFTELGTPIGTVEYMSPEQAEMSGLDVDTRTDVYALGVMLYELLTGFLPFDYDELRAAGYDEIRRRIREVEPPRPSTRVRTLGDRTSAAAANRSTEPQRLASRLRGDLDWIIMKAIEKDRTRRYGTPSELAADIERHLHHQPVLARPPGAAYRARKFVRRHRFGVGVACVAVIALVGFGAALAVQAARLARERDRANREAQVSRRVSQFLTNLFQVSDPSEARGNTITAREILDKGAEKIDEDLADSPEVQAQLMATIGHVYDTLGLYAKAERLLVRALEIQSRILGPNHVSTLHMKTSLAVVYEHQRRIDEAGALYRETLEAQRRLLGPDDPATIWSLNNVASNLEDHGKFAEAEALFREVVERRTRLLGPDHADTLTSLTNHSRLLGLLGRHAEAAELQRRALDSQIRLLGKEHPETTASMSYLATHLANMGQYDEAEGLYSEAIEIRRRVLGPEHPRTLATMSNFVNVYIQAKNWPKAEKVLRELYPLSVRVHGAADSRTTDVARSLASIVMKRGRSSEALSWLRHAVEAGYGDAKGMSEDIDLAPLRGNHEFELLAGQARRNTAPRPEQR